VRAFLCLPLDLFQAKHNQPRVRSYVGELISCMAPLDTHGLFHRSTGGALGTLFRIWRKQKVRHLALSLFARTRSGKLDCVSRLIQSHS